MSSKKRQHGKSSPSRKKDRVSLASEKPAKSQRSRPALPDQLDQLQAANQALRSELEQCQVACAQLESERLSREQQLEQTRREIMELNEQTLHLRRQQQEQAQELSGARLASEHLEAEKAQIMRELALCRSGAQVLEDEMAQMEAKLVRARQERGWELARELAQVLVNVSSLANQEPEPVIGLTPRAILEDLLDWMKEAVGERPMAFPPKTKGVNHILWLDPDEAGLESLLKEYDWSPEHPFEGLPKGERRISFRVVRRGWRVGDIVLARAQVSPNAVESTGEQV